MAPRNESGAAAEAPEAATAKPDAAEDRAADAPALFSQRGGAQAKLHVLLVEDDQATMVFVKALLKSCGHTGTSRRAVRPRNLHTSASTKPVAHHRRPFLRDIFWKRVFQRNG